MAHHPPFTAVKSRQGENPHITALTAVFEKYRVSAPSSATTTTITLCENRIHYVTAGGGGAPLYDVNKPPEGITQKVSVLKIL